MDKNSITGIILIIAIFIVWGIVTKPSEEERRAIERRNDSIAAIQAENRQLIEQQNLIDENATQNTTQENLSDSLNIIALQNRYGGFSISASGNNEFYTLENNLIEVKISTKAGRPYSVRLKDYQRYDSLPLVLFNGDSTKFNLQFYSQELKGIETENFFFKADENTPKRIQVTDTPESLTLKLTGENNQSVDYTYTLSPDSYQLDLDIKFNGIDDPTQKLSVLDLEWEIYSPRQEKGWQFESNFSGLYYKPKDEKVESFGLNSRKESSSENITTPVEWIGFKDQFFSSVIMANDEFESAQMESVKQQEDGDYIKQYKANIGISYMPGESSKIPLSFYFGPNRFKYLKKNYSKRSLQDMVMVGGGIIKWINQGVIINLFHLLSRWIGNYGIIILIMTIIIKMALLPLTFKSYMSQAKMRVVKPMVDEATAKIPKEKQMERQQATMAIYKKVGVSPLGGCLPMILQMPILFAMFRFFPTSIELRQQSFLWATDLSAYDSIFEWSAQIPILSNLYGNHVSLFTLLMTITTIISMKTNSSAQMSDSQMPGMKTMMYIMPVMFMFFLNKYSSGLTYYYFLANMITFGQNYLFKSFVDENEVLKKLQTKKAKVKKKSKWQQRIEEMQKMQQQQAKRRR